MDKMAKYLEAKIITHILHTGYNLFLNNMVYDSCQLCVLVMNLFITKTMLFEGSKGQLIINHNIIPTIVIITSI